VIDKFGMPMMCSADRKGGGPQERARRAVDQELHGVPTFGGNHPRAHQPANLSRQPTLSHIMRGVVANVYLDNRDVPEALRFPPHLAETP